MGNVLEGISQEEVLDREIPKLPAAHRVDKVLLVKVLVGTYLHQ